MVIIRSFPDQSTLARRTSPEYETLEYLEKITLWYGSRSYDGKTHGYIGPVVNPGPYGVGDFKFQI
jgi:hypothetical protein